MRKNNNKGFMLAEIIIVSAILATALVGLFATFSRTYLEYEKRNDYNHVDAIYVSRGLVNTLDVSSLAADDGFYSPIELNDFMKKYGVVKSKNTTIDEYQSYVLRYKTDAFEELENNSNLTYKFKEYVSFLKNNLDFEEAFDYIIISEVSDNCDTNRVACKEDNANVGLGYYKFKIGS